MTRLLLGAGGVLLLAVTALGVLWLAGQVLVGLGVLAVGTAGVLLRLLWFLVVAAGLGGLVYFLSNAWRPVPAARTLTPKTPVHAPVHLGNLAPDTDQTLVFAAVPHMTTDSEPAAPDRTP